jgi:hypothetical protein
MRGIVQRDHPFSSPLAILPIGMSLGALAAIFVHIARFGVAPQPDEGTTAHIWQILMGGQLPLILIVGLTWLPRRTRAALIVLGLQLAAAAAAAFPLWWFGW